MTKAKPRQWLLLVYKEQVQKDGLLLNHLNNFV